MSIDLWVSEYHIVRVELKGPRSREQLRKFDDALRKLVESSGGTVRFQAKERDEKRPRKRSRRPRAKRPKRPRRTP